MKHKRGGVGGGAEKNKRKRAMKKVERDERGGGREREGLVTTKEELPVMYSLKKSRGQEEGERERESDESCRWHLQGIK